MTLEEEIYSKINHQKKFTHSRQQGIALETVANTIGCFECLDTKLVVEKGVTVKYNIYNCDSCGDGELATQTNNIVLKRKGITLLKKNDHSNRAVEDRLRQLLFINDNPLPIDLCEGFQLEEPVVEPVESEVRPIVESVQELVEQQVEPVVESVQELVEQQVESEVRPVVETIVELVQELVEQQVESEVRPVVEPVVEPVQELVEPVESEVRPVVEPVVEPVESEVRPIVESVVEEPEEESILEENNELIEEHTETIVNETSKPNKKKNKRKSIQL